MTSRLGGKIIKLFLQCMIKFVSIGVKGNTAKYSWRILYVRFFFFTHILRVFLATLKEQYHEKCERVIRYQQISAHTENTLNSAK